MADAGASAGAAAAAAAAAASSASAFVTADGVTYDPGSGPDFRTPEAWGGSRAAPKAFLRFLKNPHRDLWLIKCGLKNIPGELFVQLAGVLRSLHVSNNKKIDSLPDEVGDCYSLEYLALEGTSIKKLPDSICRLPRLRTLRLSSSPIEELPVGLWRCGELTSLYVNTEQLEYPPPGAFLPGVTFTGRLLGWMEALEALKRV